MKNKGLEMSKNSKIEVVSRSNEELYGKTGVITDVLENKSGVELRVQFESGPETWIDADDVFVY